MESQILQYSLAILVLALVAIAIWKPGWLRFAVIIAGALAGASAYMAYKSHTDRLRQLGLSESEARPIARILEETDKIKEGITKAEDAADKDRALKVQEDALAKEIQKLSEKGYNTDAIREEMRRHFPDF